MFAFLRRRRKLREERKENNSIGPPAPVKEQAGSIPPREWFVLFLILGAIVFLVAARLMNW